MTAAELLANLRARGGDLVAAGERLTYRGAGGVLDETTRRAVADCRTELLAVLESEQTGAAEFQRAQAALDAALSASWLTPAQRRVVETFRVVVAGWHERRDPLLFGAAAWVE